MTVKEVLDLLSYGTPFELVGTYSGKVLCSTRRNKQEYIETFYERTVPSNPINVKLRMDIFAGNYTCEPMISIWVHDYEEEKDKRKKV